MVPKCEDTESVPACSCPLNAGCSPSELALCNFSCGEKCVCDQDQYSYSCSNSTKLSCPTPKLVCPTALPPTATIQIKLPESCECPADGGCGSGDYAMCKIACGVSCICQQKQYPYKCASGIVKSCYSSVPSCPLASTSTSGSTSITSGTSGTITDSTSLITKTITSSSKPQCNDGLDNDIDGLIDYPKDLSCSSFLDNDETFPRILSRNVTSSSPSLTMQALLGGGNIVFGMPLVAGILVLVLIGSLSIIITNKRKKIEFVKRGECRKQCFPRQAKPALLARGWR